ncbi:hypothetical protein JNM87_05480 [Candidatus Saccharibacteria bacterium]|nr:hypothetical protein [Candidatus Saccharibacteria bacterium]
MVGALLSWWYGQGWRLQLRKVAERYARWVDYFSFALIMRTLFAPFRQIAAGGVKGPIEEHIRAWFDRLISRAVGFTVRVFVLIAGGVWMVVLSAVAALQLVGWLLLPCLPALGVLLALMGWMPWKS